MLNVKSTRQSTVSVSSGNISYIYLATTCCWYGRIRIESNIAKYHTQWEYL